MSTFRIYALKSGDAVQYVGYTQRSLSETFELLKASGGNSVRSQWLRLHPEATIHELEVVHGEREYAEAVKKRYQVELKPSSAPRQTDLGGKLNYYLIERDGIKYTLPWMESLTKVFGFTKRQLWAWYAGADWAAEKTGWRVLGKVKEGAYPRVTMQQLSEKS